MEHLRDWTQGQARGAWSHLPVSVISTDTRAITKGAVFLALKGENFDANHFISEAIQKGAAAVICEREVNEKVPVLVVPDALKALIAIGERLRAEFSGKVIAVTGSAGKSSTKEMLAALLGPHTISSPASFNNLMGVSRTLCLLRDETKNLVLEMGMNNFHEIEELCERFRPHAGCITNVGDAHIGKLGGRDGIYRAKKELFDFLAGAANHTMGVALNVDDPLVEKAYHEAFKAPTPTVTYSAEGQRADVSVLAKGVDSGTGFLSLTMDLRGKLLELKLPLFGLHQAQNVAAATAGALLMGLQVSDFQERYSQIRAASHRGEVFALGENRVLIDESYNSNPTALLSSLSSIADIDRSRRRVLVIGDMFELGEYGEKLHEEAGLGLVKICRAKPFPMLVVGVGALTGHFLRPIRDAFPATSVPVFQVKEQGEVLPLLAGKFQKADVIFVKGSRGMKLDLVVAALLDAH